MHWVYIDIILSAYKPLHQLQPNKRTIVRSIDYWLYICHATRYNANRIWVSSMAEQIMIGFFSLWTHNIYLLHDTVTIGKKEESPVL